VLQFKQIEGGITAPKGFKAAGVFCGLKKGKKKDLAIIFSEKEANCAGVFTQNTMAAAPVILSKKHIESGLCRAVVINSAYANACTGKRGFEDSIAMAKSVGVKLGISEREVLVSSTGAIGDFLPIDKIEKGIALACQKLSCSGGSDAAQAIMTTDTSPKEIALEFELNDKKVRLGGMAKGAGMIAPNMATMLGFITTDIGIDSSLLRICLREAVNKSFNMITVDGETSTNDTVVILANGMSEIALGRDKSEVAVFREALEFACSALAKMIVYDGEGATKFITIKIKGAENFDQARRAGMSIANSVLVKTAFFGEDANLGRVLAALGHSGVKVNPEEVDVYFASEKVAAGGSYLDFNEDKVKETLRQKEIKFTVVIGHGNADATIWTTDLSHDYVEINSRYRT
jgi:glutamate N-acetyltransferase/amino-acid N-acetyltransferase